MANGCGTDSPEYAGSGTRQGFIVGTLGKGDVRVYPSGRVPAHPLSVLGLKALGKNLGDCAV